MCGSATLAIVVSRICITIAPMTPTVSSGRFEVASSGGLSAGWA